MKGRIAEIFDSVQGEGLYLGVEQVFVRFYGCNIACAYCDTKPDSFSEYEPEELLDEIKLYSHPVHSISFTGGEPLMQDGFLKEALTLTRGAGYKNYLETNGTLPLALEDVIDLVDIVAMDLKLPSSTGRNHYWDEHRRFLRIASRVEVFLKSVVSLATEESDLLEAVNLIRDINPAAVYILQPNSYDDSEQLTGKMKAFQEICRREKVTACIIPQMHKIMGIQ